jgi:1-deoxy-D-xylulose-5-phosphate reductoisomerase
MKGLSILGSTGSIGIQTLDIVRLHPDRFKVCSLAAGSNIDLLEQQIREFHPALVSCASPQGAAELQKRLSKHSPGPAIVTDAVIPATAEDVDLVIGGLPGSAGLIPSFAAVRAGKEIALATKEVLVMAGDLFMRTAREMSVNVLPVDSEQSAIFQCLQGNGESEIRRILLTASGGPFRDMPVADMAEVTAAQALHHPRWKMGPKVTVDSATLMNKGLEVLEARWLFDLKPSQIEVVIHPQSIVHSMVEFMDGSILAQLGATDMRIPISYAMAYPERIASGTEPLSFPGLRNLTFMEPDMKKFPLLKAAFQVLERDDAAASIILNAADEVAVELFLAGRIPFLHIHRIVLDALDSIPAGKTDTLEEIIAFHEEVVGLVRSRTASLVNQ